MYRPSSAFAAATQRQPPPRSHPPHRQRLANPYLQVRATSHFRDMPNPHSLPSDRPYQPRPAIPANIVTAPRASDPRWLRRQRYALPVEDDGSSTQESSVARSLSYRPRNLEREREYRLEDPELPDLDFEQWQRSADVSLLTLGQDSYDSGSLRGNTFKPTEEESYAMESTFTSHEKRVLKVHEQFI